jgi:hypothetical protein
MPTALAVAADRMDTVPRPPGDAVRGRKLGARVFISERVLDPPEGVTERRGDPAADTDT